MATFQLIFPDTSRESTALNRFLLIYI